MHIALPGAGSGPVSALAEASPRSLLDGQYVRLAVIAGVTWLALVGGVLSTYILSGAGGGPSRHYTPAFAAYDMREVVSTSYGLVVVTDAEQTPTSDLVEVHVSMVAENKLDGPADAPRIEDLRLINTQGVEARPKPGAWSGPAVLAAHSSATIDVTYEARKDMGLLWLEYREPVASYPLRFSLGVERAPLPAAAVGPGDVQ
jgi:hypothetical protein